MLCSRENTAALGQLILATGPGPQNTRWSSPAGRLEMTGLPLDTASMGGKHSNCSQCSAHHGLGTEGLGQAAWPQSVKNKTGLFSSTVIYYQCFKNPKQSQLFYIWMLDSITVFLPQFIKVLLGKAV